MQDPIFANINKIIERDSKATTYKFALLRGVIDIIQDKFPVNPGLALIIPKRYEMDYFGLSPEEAQSCWEMLHQAKNIIQDEQSIHLPRT
jgi:diadenosine tetraphosphate (Ap4A) HIT family hydrolase